MQENTNPSLEIDRTKKERGIDDGRKWPFLVIGIDELRERLAEGETVVFSGGSCNIIDADGERIRGTGRDKINEHLNTRGIYFFDPQIHPDTHNRDYDWDKDGPAENEATIKSKKLSIYQIGSDTLGAVTMLEIGRDTKDPDSSRVVWFTQTDLEDADFYPLGLDNLNIEKKKKS